MTLSKNESIQQFKVQMLTRWYPKGGKQPKHNDWQIIRAKVIAKTLVDEEFETEHGQVTLVGNMVAMEPGLVYNVQAVKEFNDKFQKTQYRVVYSQEIREFKTKQQVDDFLLMFLSPRQIQSLYSVHENPLEVIDSKNVEELCKASGIGKFTAESIIERYESCKDYGPTYGELGKVGITKAMIDKLIKHFKSADVVLHYVKNNPYELANCVDGIGFKKADDIALKNGIHKHDAKRVKAFIIHALHEIADNYGSTYVSYDTVLDKIDETLGTDTPQNVIDEVIDKLIDDKVLWCKDTTYEDGTMETKLALMKYYNIEKRIAQNIQRLLKAPNKVNLTQEQIDASIKAQETKQGWDYTETQKYGVKVIADNNVVIIRGYGGCVDCDTEYFNGYGWKRIADYEEGEKVLQYTEDGKAELVTPTQYVKLPQDYLVHFHTKYGTDQCLSLGHRVVYETSRGKLRILPFDQVLERHINNVSGFVGKFRTTFEYEGSGIDLTDAQIRVQVAVIADGYFGSGTNHCYLHCKKHRKKERLEKLLQDANIPYKYRYKEKTGYHAFTFYAPRREKEFSSYWYNCNKHQFEIVCNELPYWDGSQPSDTCTVCKNTTFYSCSKSTIDFAQFAYATLGKRCNIMVDDRKNSKTQKSVGYYFSVCDRNKVGIGGFSARDTHKKTPMKLYKTTDGYQYCFSVPSTMLVLRRNGKVFITGNTGKSSTVAGLLACLDEDYRFVQCALSGKASVNLVNITGREGYTIHRLLGFQPGSGFTVNKDNPLDVDMVILDEGSMVDISLAVNLLEAIPSGAKLVILGDSNQLEAIGAGNFFLDLIDSEIIPVVTFDKIHRQGAKSGIIPFSIDVANGHCKYKQNWQGEEVLGELQDLKMIGFNCSNSQEPKPSIDLIMREYKEMYNECKDISQITVVLPTNTRGTCTQVVNKLIQDFVQPKRRRGDSLEIGKGQTKNEVFRGDRVLVLKNNYQLDIYNGNVGEVVSIDKENGKLVVDIYGKGEVELSGEALEHLDLGYAVSGHKCQGATIPYLIYCIDYTHYVMLCKEQVYTGITRGKKKASFIFETRA